ncbi:MAG: Universal stress protein [Methanoregulaceae archaeon PtaU1.Bin222]|nr:MAG: Universal stress protein [Methanoregulaceae archaeon PtaU1.Bin222]
MFSRILFPTDFSEYAKRILDCITGFPGVKEVLLLHVIEETRSPWGGGEIGIALSHNEKITLREEKRYLESLGSHIRVTSMVKISSDTAEAIIEYAEEKDVSLIVIGARGNSLVEGILLGSVSMAVLRRSRTSVLIMRHRVVEEIDGKKRYQQYCPMLLSRVLCPVDFSPYSEHAISRLLATEGVGEVILVYVVSRGESSEEIARCQKRARELGLDLRSRFTSQRIPARVIVRTGNPASEIIRVAEEEDVSLIWMSYSGRGWFRELLIGSTADHVAVNSTCPVMIIRSKSPEDVSTNTPRVDAS